MDRAFITGSQAYGTPHSKSDVDVCMLLPKQVIEQLHTFTEQQYTLRFGKLNIIAFDELNNEHFKFYDSWKTANEELVKRKPVTREEAIKYLEENGVGKLPDGVYGNHIVDVNCNKIK